MKILVLKKGDVEKNVITTEEKAEAFNEGGYDEIRDITEDGYSFEDLYKGKPNTTPNWHFDFDLSDIHEIKVLANGKPTPYGDRIPDITDRGFNCLRQWFTNGSYYIVGMGVEA